MPLTILEHFPIEDLPPRQAEPDDQEERENRVKQVQGSLIVQKAVPIKEREEEEEEHINRPGEFYQRYRNVDELPDAARAFFERAGTFSSRKYEALC